MRASDHTSFIILSQTALHIKLHEETTEKKGLSNFNAEESYWTVTCQDGLIYTHMEEVTISFLCIISHSQH